MNSGSRVLGLLALPAFALFMLVVAELRPGYFNNVTYLGAILLLEVIAVTVWHYDKWFFLILMLVFLWAGMDIPLAGGSIVRWVFLAVGALVGLIKWAGSDRRKRLGGLHLVALLCFLTSVVSSVVSSHSQISLLKSSSLFLLFLYTSCGIRATLTDREDRFFRGLLTACEIIAYLSGFSYLVLRYELFGNPNSLGATMGVAVIPVLLWGMLIADQPNVRQRRTIALCIAVYLLIASMSRAALLACALTVVIMCLTLRRQKILIKAAFLLIVLTAVIAVVQPSSFDTTVSAFWEDLLYKGKPEQGLLGSRTSPWQETADVIKESPWFGTGFGMDVTTAPATDAHSMSTFRTAGGTAKEHGNSYLALVQYVGLLGMVPFTILMIMSVRIACRVFVWTWKTRDARNFAVPLAAVCLAGLIHAFFEDWLFAIGYYLTVFFWTAVFILSDLQPGLPRRQFLFSRVWNRRAIPASQISLSAHQ